MIQGFKNMSEIDLLVAMAIFQILGCVQKKCKISQKMFGQIVFILIPKNEPLYMRSEWNSTYFESSTAYK